MWALPRAEQPYTLNHPHLDIDNEVHVVFEEPADPGEEENAAEKERVKERVVRDQEAGPVGLQPPTTTQFNVSGYVGGKDRASRFLALKHANKVPPPEIDEAVLAANVGFRHKPQSTQHNARETFVPHRNAAMARPDAAMEVYQPFTYMLPEDPLQFDEHLAKHTRVEYDIDEADLAVLGLLATRYRVQMLPEVFEVTMSMLDLAAALICLKMFPLERAAREQRGLLNTVDNRRCAVCNWAECTDSNTIVFCDGCDVAVHQDCYGVHSIPEGRWLCRKCESGHGADIKCVLCPHTSGAFKQTTGGDWIHLVCALWTPLVYVPENTSFLEPVRDLELMEPGRWTLNCYVCRTKRRGACIQCAARDCYVAFHPTCAQTAGFYMTNCNHDFGEMLKQQQYLPVYCHRHSLQHAPAGFPPPSLDAARQALVDEQLLFKQQNVSLFAHKRYNYWRTKRHVLILPQVVVAAVQRSLKQRLHVELSTDVIEFLCRYWTIKKDQNDGVMFNRRLHHALEVAQHRVIRAEQSEEQERTPGELLELVNALLKTLKPNETSTTNNDEINEAESTAHTNTKHPAKTSGAARERDPRPGARKRPAAQAHKRALREPLANGPLANRRENKAESRRLPSTRKRMKELGSTVASMRKMRTRKSI